jgi:hypothetical protein
MMISLHAATPGEYIGMVDLKMRETMKINSQMDHLLVSENVGKNLQLNLTKLRR